MGSKTSVANMGWGNMKDDVTLNSRQYRRALKRKQAKEEKKNGKGSIRHRN